MTRCIASWITEYATCLGRYPHRNVLFRARKPHDLMRKSAVVCAVIGIRSLRLTTLVARVVGVADEAIRFHALGGRIVHLTVVSRAITTRCPVVYASTEARDLGF